MRVQRARQGTIVAQRALDGRLVTSVALLVFGVLGPSGILAAAQIVDTPTGIHAVVHAADDVAAQAVTEDGRTWLHHPGLPPVEIDTAQHPWSALTPLPAAEVVAALMAMQGFTTTTEVDVYILPGFPTSTWSSFARADAIYLAPSLAPVAASTVHYVVTHEMGHVLTAAAIDPQPDRWSSYLAMRGLTAAALSPGAAHAEQAREILAEDLRDLFGGPLATLSGTIENPRLALPGSVAGLREALVSWLADPAATSVVASSRALPNPCNPRTVIELSLPEGAVVDGAAALLGIFDLRGHLVRRVVGAEIAGGVARVAWDGADDAGRTVASGPYLYELRLGASIGRGRLSVVR